MQTHLADWIRDTPDGQEADAILRTCVHCGFCNATCPTYQLLGDELDGPRGRIYLIKQALEGGPITATTQLHLDRCLTCRNCETTCPSGVQYGRLVDIGRKVVEQKVPRPLRQKAARTALMEGLTSGAFAPALKLGQIARSLLPAVLRNKVPTAQSAGRWPTQRHARKMILLAGCVQPAMQPNINSATARVFDALGIELVIAGVDRSAGSAGNPRNSRSAAAGCCGAIRHHLSDHDGALIEVRRNIDAWWPRITAAGSERAEAIVINASGCGAMVKDYGHLLRNEPLYAEKARRVSELTRDVAEVVPQFERELLALIAKRTSSAARAPARVAFHASCTLQHGQQIRGVVESFLAKMGAQLASVNEPHLCCGSAGTYSVLQPELAYRLRDRKLANLQGDAPETILSANIGCITHLQSGTERPVRHWIEWLDEQIA